MIRDREIIGKIAIVVFIILAIVFIVQIIFKIIGKSPDDVQILYVGLSAIISYLLVMSYKLGQFVGEVREFMSASKNTFKKIGEELVKRKR